VTLQQTPPAVVHVSYMYYTPAGIRPSDRQRLTGRSASTCIVDKSNKLFINTKPGIGAAAYYMYYMYYTLRSNGKQRTSARLAVGS
jgi:hypothetical protein